MANWIFRSSKLFRSIVQLEFELETEPQRIMSVTIPLENANRLAAGVINALRAAEQQGSQIPPIDLGNKQMMSIDELVVDQWRVTESPELVGRCFLHLQTQEGLYLTYSFQPDKARFAGEALIQAAGPQKNDRQSEIPH